MTLVCTLALTCDACGQLISHTSTAVEGPVMVPEMPTLFNMHLCRSCGGLAAEAVHSVIDPIQLASKAKRSS